MPTAAIPAGDRPLLAGVELGGTKCICILARGPDEIVDLVEVPTRGPDETFAAIAAVLDGWRFAALGIASFGPVDLEEGCIAGWPVTMPPPIRMRCGRVVSTRLWQRKARASAIRVQTGWSGGRSSPFMPVRAAIAGPQTSPSMQSP